jgi:hypothetical protein
MYVRLRAYVRLPGRVGVCMRVLAYSLIQHATRMRHIVTSFVATLAAPHFSALSRKRRDFREKFVEYGMCLDLFYNCFLKHFSF